MDKNICPICNCKGDKVPTITVNRIVKDNKNIKSNDYYICLNSNCSTGYFNNELNQIFNSKDLKKTIWYKNNVNPKIICYCLNITEEDIILNVIETGLKNVEHISYYLKGGLGDQCVFENPSGKCCANLFKETINKALVLKEALKNKDNSHPLFSRYQNLTLDSIHVSLDDIEAEKNKHCGGSCSGSCGGHK